MKNPLGHGHAICEVWDTEKKRRILVDPDHRFLDFSPDRFEFSASAWKRLRSGKANPEKYIAALSKGDYVWKHTMN